MEETVVRVSKLFVSLPYAILAAWTFSVFSILWMMFLKCKYLNKKRSNFHDPYPSIYGPFWGSKWNLIIRYTACYGPHTVPYSPYTAPNGIFLKHNTLIKMWIKSYCKKFVLITEVLMIPSVTVTVASTQRPPSAHPASTQRPPSVHSASMTVPTRMSVHERPWTSMSVHDRPWASYLKWPSMSILPKISVHDRRKFRQL